MAGERISVHIAVDPLAGIVGVQGDDAVELSCPKILFQKPHFGLLGFLVFGPEAAVQILAGFPLACSRFESPGIADRVDKEFVELRDLRVLLQFVEQLDGGDHARLLVTVDSCKDPHPVE